MTLSDAASIANLIAALGVIGSLLLLVLELRKSNEQGRLNNWHAAVTALREHKRRTDDPRVADVIARGRVCFEDLCIAEKITFGYWMEELLQAYDAPAGLELELHLPCIVELHSLVCQCRTAREGGVTINGLLSVTFGTARLAGNFAAHARREGRDADAVCAARIAKCPASRLGRPQEFGAACAFQCSAHAGYINGQNLLLDGGSFGRF